MLNYIQSEVLVFDYLNEYLKYSFYISDDTSENILTGYLGILNSTDEDKKLRTDRLYYDALWDDNPRPIDKLNADFFPSAKIYEIDLEKVQRTVDRVISKLGNRYDFLYDQWQSIHAAIREEEVKLSKTVTEELYVLILCSIICRYFLGEYKEALEDCKRAMNRAISKSEQVFIEKFEAVIRIEMQDHKETTVRFCNMHSPGTIDEIRGIESLCSRIHALNHRLLIRSDIRTYHYNNERIAYSEMHAGYRYVIFLGHGGDKGFRLNFSDVPYDEDLNKELFAEYSSKLDTSDTCMIMLGCSGNLYESSDFDISNRVYTTNGFNLMAAEQFLAGFLLSGMRGFKSEECWKVGLLSTALRSLTANYIEYRAKSQA